MRVRINLKEMLLKLVLGVKINLKKMLLKLVLRVRINVLLKLQVEVVDVEGL